jgi:hypothetical protein
MLFHNQNKTRIPLGIDGVVLHHDAGRDLVRLEAILRFLRSTSPQTEAELLVNGPYGARVRVIDYDAASGKLLPPADVIADTESTGLLADPAFHAQNVYAIIMRTLAHNGACLFLVHSSCAGHRHNLTS